MFVVIFDSIVLVLCICLMLLSFYAVRPKYEVMIDDVGNIYLEKCRKMYHVLGYDEHFVYILRKDNQKFVVPNREIKSLDLLYSDFYNYKNEKAGD